MPYLGNVPSSFNVDTNNINNGAITTEKIADGAVVNADVSASAAIAGTKISPDFGSQNIATTGLFSHALGTAGAPTITFTGDVNTGIYSPGADQVAISTGGSGRLFVDASGRILVGNSATTGVAGFNGFLQLQGTNFDTATVALTNVAANNTGSYLLLGKARGGTLGGYTSVNNGDNLGQIRFMGADGTGYVEAAYIGVTCNGVPGTNNMPGRLFFSTNSGTSSVTERMCITPSGLVGVGTSTPQAALQIGGSTSTGTVQRLLIACNAGSATTEISLGARDSDGLYGTRISAITNLNSTLASNLTFSTNDTTGSPTERVRIDSSGRVGIGTTSPGSPLQVNGAGGIRVNEDGAGTNQIQLRSDWAGQGPAINVQTNQSLIFTTNATERVRIDTSGRLGIGSTSPADTFDCRGDARVQAGNVRFMIRPSGGTSGWLQFSEDGVADRWSVGIANGDSSLIFKTGGSFSGTERCRLDGSGRLLVGTSSARSNFAGNTSTPLVQIEGVTAATASSSVVRGAADSTGPTFNLGKTRGASVGQHTVVASDDQCGVITFQGADGTNLIRAAQISAAVDGTPGANDMPGRLVFSTTADGAASPTERLRIDSSGRVGIGSSTPGSLLHVTGSGIIAQFLNTQNSTGEGIGIGAGTNIGRITSNGAACNLVFEINGTEKARLDTSGRLLVGTSTNNSSFNAAIQIAGSSSAGTQLISRFDNNSGSPNLYFAKSRGASVGTNTLVQSGDEVGNIGFYAADGTNYVPAAQIRVDVDGTPGTNDMPGRLVFSTTADGASSPTERFRINNAGSFSAVIPSGSTLYPGFWCRAWINFDGTSASIGTGRGSGNVSSVTDNGAGDYTVNFTTAMPDANYCCNVTGGDTPTINRIGHVYSGTRATGSIRVAIVNNTGVLSDSNDVNVAIFR